MLNRKFTTFNSRTNHSRDVVNNKKLKMRILKILLVILIVSINIKCSNSEEPIVTNKTNVELLSSKEWKFDKFIFISSDYNPGNHSPEKIESFVNSGYQDNVTYKFKSDNSGYLLFKSENREFTWSLVENELKLDFENDDFDTDYILNSINESSLNITFNHSVTAMIEDIETVFKGNYFYN